jgi:hypothetical protein
MTRTRALGAVVLAATALGPARADATDLLAPLLADMEAAYARVTSYTARLVRQERVGTRLRPPEEARLKFQRPGSVYMHWITGPAAGRELLFVEGRDDGKVLVHEPRFLSNLFTLVLAPDSPRIFQESRHPATDVGLGRLIELIAGDTRRGQRAGELTIVDRGLVGEAGSRARVFELVLPREATKGYYCHRALLSLHPDLGLPVRAQFFDGEEQLLADYAYRDLELNRPLTPLDFDPRNPAYGFPRLRVRL